MSSTIVHYIFLTLAANGKGACSGEEQALYDLCGIHVSGSHRVRGTDGIWKLVAEDLVLEDGRLYEIFSAEPGDMAPIEPLLLEIGPLLWEKRHPLLLEHLGRLVQKLKKRSIAMQNSDSPVVLTKLQACQEKICALEGKIRCLSTVE